jgi:hypothetical protein
MPAPRALALSLVAAPVAFLAGSALSPGVDADFAAELATVAAHPDRWSAFMALVALGSLAFIPAAIGLHRLCSSRLGLAAATLFAYGNAIAAADAISELGVREMVVPGADRAQMAALMERVDSSFPGVLFFTTGGLSYLLGGVLLGVALWRRRTVPVWSAALFGTSVMVNLIGWAASSDVVIAATAAGMLVAALPIASALAVTTPDHEAVPV